MFRLSEDGLHIMFWPEDRRCEDCELRGALRRDGAPRRHPWYGFRLTQGCEGCGGSGRSSRDHTLYFIPVDEFIRRLTSKQRFVFTNRLMFVNGNGHKRMSQVELAQAMGVSQPAVSQLEQAVVGKMYRLTHGSSSRQVTAADTAVSKALSPGSGYVYFIQAGGDEGAIKIGWTEKDVHRRLRSLQHANPETLTLLGRFPRPPGPSEKAVHRRFADDRIRGEWFRCSPALLLFIKEKCGLSTSPTL